MFMNIFREDMAAIVRWLKNCIRDKKRRRNILA